MNAKLNYHSANKEIKENKDRIIKVLTGLRLKVEEISVTTGVSISFYEVKLKSGYRLAKINNCIEDITNHFFLGTRLIVPRPYNDSIGIELPNKTPGTVSIKSIITSKEFTNKNIEIPIAFGETIDNKPYIIDLAKANNIIIAGSDELEIYNSINTIISSIFYRKRQAQIKFLLIDTKQQFGLYSKIENQLLAKLPNEKHAIITNIEKVRAALSSLDLEIDRRYELLKKTQTRNLVDYNKLIENHVGEMADNEILPHLVLVINDLADVFDLDNNGAIELLIARIARLGKSVGIHIIIATQCPSVNVLTGSIKANIPTRISFKVKRFIDSRIILDQGGAQRLIGKGDALISDGGSLRRVQSAKIGSSELNEIIDLIAKKEASPNIYYLPEPDISIFNE